MTLPVAIATLTFFPDAPFQFLPLQSSLLMRETFLLFAALSVVEHHLANLYSGYLALYLFVARGANVVNMKDQLHALTDLYALG